MKKMGFLFSLLFSVLASANLGHINDVSVQEIPSNGEAVCPTIDLSSRLGSVRNQQNLMWCYGYTAADLVTHYLNKNSQEIFMLGVDTSKQVSAFQMVAEYQRSTSGQTLISSQRTGGFTALALEQALSSARLCTEQNLASVGGTRAKFLQKIAEVAAERFAAGNYPEDQKESKIMELQIERQVVEEQLNRLCTTPLHDLLKVESLRDSDRQSPQTPSSIPTGEYGDNIRRALTEGDIIGVDYFAGFLQGNENPSSGDHARHASSIIGQKFINGKCHYMLRNSWGPNCNLYVEPYKTQCESGVIYVEEQQFLTTLYGITRIKAKNSHDIEAMGIEHENPAVRISH